MITNPLGAHVTVTDYSTAVGYTDDGQLIHHPALQTEFRANAAVTKGDFVEFVAATSSVPLSVTPMPSTGAEEKLFAGVALADAAAGDAVRVALPGSVAPARVDTSAAAENVCKIPDTTAGVSATSAVALAATDVVGDVLGVCLSADASGVALVKIAQF